jgi:hypothetical protein
VSSGQLCIKCSCHTIFKTISSTLFLLTFLPLTASLSLLKIGRRLWTFPLNLSGVLSLWQEKIFFKECGFGLNKSNSNLIIYINHLSTYFFTSRKNIGIFLAGEKCVFLVLIWLVLVFFWKNSPNVSYHAIFLKKNPVCDILVLLFWIKTGKFFLTCWKLELQSCKLVY